MGYLRSDEKGNAYMVLKTKTIKLIGDNSIIGRACVVNDNLENVKKA